MNESKYLIYHYSSKSEKWYDATKNVVWFCDDGNAWKVKFLDSDEYYHVSFQKMHIHENPKKIKFVELYYKGSPCYQAKLLLCFDDKLYKIFYENGYTTVALPSEIKIVQDALTKSEHASGVMAYYRRVVQEIVRDEEDQFLLQQFDDISYVNEDSVLALYLNNKLASNNPNLKHPIISPFGINLSQSKAIDMMFTNKISIVEGPPGTGKTQTILNFIANALINNKSVAVVSNNNSATDNVYEKLDKYGYSFVAAPLGNADNVEEFFDNFESDIPSFTNKAVNSHTLNNLHLSLPQYFSIENKKKKLNEKLTELHLEHKHFLLDHNDIDFSKVKFKADKVKSSNVLNAIIEFKERKKKLSFWSKLLLRIRLKIDKSFFSIDLEDVVIYLNNLYYLSKIHEIENDIEDLNKRMNNQTLSEKTSLYVSLSKTYFENELIPFIKNNTRHKHTKDNYKRQFEEFVKDYPVILSSTYSLAKCTKRGFLFDYLIVDESSQVNMASAILSMRVAKNLVVVGDIKQLPQIDDSLFKDRNTELLKQFNVSKEYSYFGNSIMSSLLSLYGDRIPKTMLKEHYRCNPNIISFCNKRFYDDQLIIYTSNRNADYSLKVIKTAPGNFARKNPDGTGLYNQREIDEIKALLDKEKLDDVGVIAPYRYQTEVINEQLGNKVDASTIHKFQGREKKTIIFSSTVNDTNEFVGNDNLVNVAVSRAVDKFILVTSDKIFKSNSGVLADLVNYISYNSEFGIKEEGTVKSIYDLLYDDYQEQLIRFRSRHPSKDFDSENLTKALLQKILSEKQYASFGCRMHVSLKDFINSKNLDLSYDEYKFLKNPNSHADFLIFNKMSKKPLLVIEVDGVSFHEQQKIQVERDTKKNSILEKTGINILRLKTNESDEANRIKNTLNSII